MPRPPQFDETLAAARILGVLAGRDMPSPMLKKWAESADVVFAADAGLDVLRAAGAEADVAVGDFDSSMELAQFGGQLVVDRSEASTDADKLLRVAVERGIRRITLASVEGDQLDHMLAALHSAARAPLEVRIALRTGLGWVMNAGTALEIRTSPGRRVSLLPLEHVGEANLGGVRWPLEGATLHPLGATSISNRATGPAVTATIGAGSAFLFVGYPEEELPIW